MKYFLSQLYLLRSLQKYWNTFFVPSCPRNVPFMSNRCLSIFSKIWEFTFLELWGNQHALKKKQYAPWEQTPCCLWFYISAYISTSICSEVLNNRTTTCFVPSECWLAMPSNFLFESIPWLIYVPLSCTATNTRGRRTYPGSRPESRGAVPATRQRSIRGSSFFSGFLGPLLKDGYSGSHGTRFVSRDECILVLCVLLPFQFCFPSNTIFRNHYLHRKYWANARVKYLRLCPHLSNLNIRSPKSSHINLNRLWCRYTMQLATLVSKLVNCNLAGSMVSWFILIDLIDTSHQRKERKSWCKDISCFNPKNDCRMAPMVYPKIDVGWK